MTGIVICILAGLIGCSIGAFFGVTLIGRQYDIHCERIEKNADKFSDYYSLIMQWLKITQDDKSVCEYFKKNQYMSVAIYGMNDMAYALIHELKKYNIEIAYCIDRNADNLFLEYDVFRPDEELPKADVCVVALPDAYDDVHRMLKGKIACPIVSIETVVWNE